MIDTKALRSRILDLAIQGKLTEQLPGDDSIDKLLEEVSDEKKELIAAKIIKNKRIKPIDKTEIPFDIPSTWRLVYIDDIAFVTKLAGFEYTDTIAPNLSENGIPLFKGKNIQDGKIILEFESYIPQTISDELPRSQVLNKCLLTPYVGTIGNIAIFDGSFCAHLGSNVGKIELLNNRATHVLEEYVLYYLRSSIGNKQLSKFKKATAQDSISIEAIRNTIVVLPPLAEQKRIVERVEEIFRLLDTIDEAQDKYSADSQILKAKLITAGIQGKLTKQLPSDGTAEELFAKKLKAIEDTPFDIPDNWKWCKGVDCFKPMESRKPTGEYFHYIDIDAIDNKHQRIDQIKTVVTKEAPSRASRAVFEGSTLFSLVRPYLRNIAFVDSDASNSIASTGFFVATSNGSLYPLFLYYLMISDYVVMGLNEFMKGDNSPSIRKGHIEQWLFPVPPLAEQKRIADVLERALGALERK